VSRYIDRELITMCREIGRGIAEQVEPMLAVGSGE
jgi:hypothetical protein